MTEVNPTQLEHCVRADIEFDTDEPWDLAGADYEEELLDAIEQAKDGERVFVRPDGPYIMEARPNPKTDTVRVTVYGVALTLEPVDDDGNAVTYES